MDHYAIPKQVVFSNGLISYNVLDLPGVPDQTNDFVGARSLQPRRNGVARAKKFDAAMKMLVVIPINKRRNPLAGFLLETEWSVGIVRPVFNGGK